MSMNGLDFLAAESRTPDPQGAVAKKRAVYKILFGGCVALISAALLYVLSSRDDAEATTPKLQIGPAYREEVLAKWR